MARPSKSANRQAALGVTTRVLRLRIKDKHAAHLLAQSREVNQVWNYSQDLALKVLEREHRFMSAYDMAAYTKGAAKEGLSLHSQTVQAVSEESKPVLWSRSYCMLSCGGAPLEIIKQYIQQQDRPDD